MPTPIEDAIAERDAARSERDAAVTAQGKVTAQLEGLGDLAADLKAENAALKAEVQKKIDAGQKADKLRKKLVDDATALHAKAQSDAKASRIEKDKAKAAQAVETKNVRNLSAGGHRSARCIENHPPP